MAPTDLVLLGLTLAWFGAVCFIWGEMKTGAALIKHYTGQLPGGFFKKVAYRAAQRFGPSDPRDQQEYEAD
jgi:hypothetical protein